MRPQNTPGIPPPSFVETRLDGFARAVSPSGGTGAEGVRTATAPFSVQLEPIEFMLANFFRDSGHDFGVVTIADRCSLALWLIGTFSIITCLFKICEVRSIWFSSGLG